MIYTSELHGIDTDILNKAVAIYRVTRTGKRAAIMPSLYCGFWLYRLDYEGLFAGGATAGLPDYIMRIIQAESNGGEIEWLKTPQTPYHVWHICYCDRCRGKVWTHSQSDWDSHLRSVDDNESIITFPTKEAVKCLPC